eukprot:TRINITY_DN32035_c0_g1_i1.p1 TRINITY_DN32035_c0_g1~~TRINITY_DN32035_c0_g1_i1.p1  ORF type:complete len:516 (+),score=70.04 TRINITY_DN32035_c0_g1_i1:91-1638(+)
MLQFVAGTGSPGGVPLRGVAPFGFRIPGDALGRRRRWMTCGPRAAAAACCCVLILACASRALPRKQGPPAPQGPLPEAAGGGGRGLHVAVVSLEFVPPLFSGNGVYARTLVKGLLLPALRSRVRRITVLAGCPSEGSSETCADPDPDLAAQISAGRLSVVRVPVPADRWRRLDRLSPWEEFAERAAAVLPQAADVSMLIDWHAVPVFEAAVAARHVRRRCVALSFRVYHASPGLADGAREKHFFSEQERRALPGEGNCGSALALTDLDRAMLLRLCKSAGRCAAALGTLPPALRPDVAAEARRLGAPDDWAVGRRYLVSCVRLSPEKRAHAFAEALAALGRDFLAAHGVVPLLCGAHANASYAASVVAAVRAVSRDAVVEPNFLGARRLGELFGAALLNVHPPLYDAYGMTVAEAAAFGAPTLLHQPRPGMGTPGRGLAEGIGAAAMLQPGRGEALVTDFSDSSAVAAALRRLLAPSGRPELRAAASKARTRALLWTEERAAEELVRVLLREAAR